MKCVAVCPEHLKLVVEHGCVRSTSRSACPARGPLKHSTTQFGVRPFGGSSAPRAPDRVSAELQTERGRKDGLRHSRAPDRGTTHQHLRDGPLWGLWFGRMFHVEHFASGNVGLPGFVAEG